VIVLDEPTAGVDVELRQTLWQFVRRLNSAGHTIVLTTHYLEEAQELCGRIAMLKAGRVIALDSTRALLARLDTQDRAAVIMRYWYEMSDSEIGAALSLTVPAVKSRLHRARRELASLWSAAQPAPLTERRKNESPAF
jgi:ABC-2 type transport system ATP-binding protein